MSRTVFILGAGASRESGGPLISDFLDIAYELRRKGLTGPDAQSFDLVFDAIAELQSIHSKSTLDLDNIEAVFAAFEMLNLFGKQLASFTEEQIQNLGPSIRRVIVRVLETQIRLPVTRSSGAGVKVEPPPPYQAFANLLMQMQSEDRDSVTVITFNYDLALDYAFHFLNVPVDYCLDSANRKGHVQIMKLHGSLNWARFAGNKAAVAWPLESFLSRHSWPLLTPGEPVPLLLASHLSDFKMGDESALPDPVIVPPTWNKTQYQNQIAPVWRRASLHLSAAENIFVMGYSLPETDPFFRYLYALGTLGKVPLKRFWVFDPNPTEEFRSRYEKLLGLRAKNRFRIFRMAFGEASVRFWRGGLSGFEDALSAGLLNDYII